MVIHNPKKTCVAISYDSVTFAGLKVFLQEESVALSRVTPEEFFDSYSSEYQYINLITKDMQLRKKISTALDVQNLDRFAYVHESSILLGCLVTPGSMIYPNVITYSGTKFGKDLLIHGNTGFAHGTEIDDGCFFGGSIHISGSCKIGKFCYIGSRVTLCENVHIDHDVIIGVGSLVRKNINFPGTYADTSRGIRKLQIPLVKEL
jgi:acetyltransferase-like isoleucine patch superfamily enzyme